jgi:predicted AAA+ superfamily ATPase
VIITLDQSAEWQESGVSIKAIPAWQFLLGWLL